MIACWRGRSCTCYLRPGRFDFCPRAVELLDSMLTLEAAGQLVLLHETRREFHAHFMQQGMTHDLEKRIFGAHATLAATEKGQRRKSR